MGAKSTRGGAVRLAATALAGLALLAGGVWAASAPGRPAVSLDDAGKQAVAFEIESQIGELRPSLKAELKAELSAELKEELATCAAAGGSHSGPEPGPIRWMLEDFSFYRGQTALLREAIDKAGPTVSRTVEGALNEGLEWDVGYTSKKRCTDLEHHVLPGQRMSCIPRLQTLTWKDSFAETLVAEYGVETAFNITPPTFVIPEQVAEWKAWAAGAGAAEGEGSAWVLKELRHGKVGVTILPFKEAVAAADEMGDDGGHRYRVVQRYLKDQMLADALGGDCALRAWVLVTHVDPLRAYLFDGGIFESNTKHLTYWQAANEGVLGKTGSDASTKKEDHTALGADNEKPTPWALGRLRAFVRNATGSHAAFDQLWADVASITADAVRAGANHKHCNLPHSGWRCGARPFVPGAWELFGLDLMFDSKFKPTILEVNASPAIKRRAFWNADYSTAPPDSDFAVLGREYDDQNAAVVTAYEKLIDGTTVRSPWKRPGCTIESCPPYNTGACPPGAKDDHPCVKAGGSEAALAESLGWRPLVLEKWEDYHNDDEDEDDEE